MHALHVGLGAERLSTNMHIRRVTRRACAVQCASTWAQGQQAN